MLETNTKQARKGKKARLKIAKAMLKKGTARKWEFDHIIYIDNCANWRSELL